MGGLLVEITRADELAGAIVALARDPARRAEIGRTGRERALELFTAERMAANAWEVALRAAGRPAVA